MKNIFVILMISLIVASCGGTKSEETETVSCYRNYGNFKRSTI
jgi:hypothetical protein